MFTRVKLKMRHFCFWHQGGLFFRSPTNYPANPSARAKVKVEISPESCGEFPKNFQKFEGSRQKYPNKFAAISRRVTLCEISRDETRNLSTFNFSFSNSRSARPLCSALQLIISNFLSIQTRKTRLIQAGTSSSHSRFRANFPSFALTWSHIPRNVF